MTESLTSEVRPLTTVWKITIQTSKAARLAETARISRDDQHAIELAEAEAEIDRLREDRDIKARDWQDGLAINTGLEAELAAARARLAELEAKKSDGAAR